MLYNVTCPVCTSIDAIADKIQKEEVLAKPESREYCVRRHVVCHCEDCGAKFQQDEYYFLDRVENIVIESEFEDDFIDITDSIREI